MVEQLKYQKMRVEQRGSERIIIDPALTTQRAFMYFYMCINVGSIVGQVTMVYAERYVGFWLSFLLPTIMFGMCPLVLLIFRNKYVKRQATGSVLGKATSLICFALKKSFSINPATTWVPTEYIYIYLFHFTIGDVCAFTYSLTCSIKNIRSPDFWENVKPSHVVPKPKFMTFDDAWVDEVARGCKACVVFLLYPLFCRWTSNIPALTHILLVLRKILVTSC